MAKPVKRQIVSLMKYHRFYYSLPALICLILFNVSCNGQTDYSQAFNLQTEYLMHPLGIDVAEPRFTWQMNDTRQGAAQTAYRLVIAADSAGLLEGKNITWDTGKIASNRMRLTYEGPALVSFTRYYWSVTIWDKDGKKSHQPGISWFETGLMDAKEAKGQWISDTMISYPPDTGRDPDKKGAGYFRKDFSSPSPIINARVYIAAAGYYELYLNGTRSQDHMLDPAKTRYDRRTTYVTHDVTSLIEQGENTIGVILGNGWYNHQSTAVWFFHEAPWRGRPSFWADMRITYEDGSEMVVSSNTRWKTTSEGPIIFNSIYTGEHYDARRKLPGWNRPGYDDNQWSDAVTVQAPAPLMVAQAMHPVRITETIPARTIRKVDDRTYIFDLGINISGISKLVAEGEPGTVIRLKHGERLNEYGRVDQSNIDQHYRPADDSDPFQTDIFILSGEGPDSFMPRFNYKGFQYVEVTADRPLELSQESLIGYFMHSDVPPVGRIETSNELINQIWRAGNQSYLSNLFGYPTDCPQREKLGWTGDGHIAIETGLFNFDGITIYEKWIADHRDEQQPNGLLPAIIPTSGWGYHWANGVDWTSSLLIVPWKIYLFYGDSRLLAESYDHMKNYVEYIYDRYPSGLTDWGLGDWVPVNSRANVELTSTVYYFVVAGILAKTASLLDKPDDAHRYSALADKIFSAFNDKFFDDETGLYGSGYQTELSMPLFWGLVPEHHKAVVARNLAESVEANNFHIDVGLLGSKALLNALSENGYAEVAYRVATQDAYPSWGWWMVNGATTFFENWSVDADRDISMNHIMFGEISAWFYKALGGINPDPEYPGFENVILRPHFVDGLDAFKAEYDSPRGTISSSWEKDGSDVHYTVTVPANSTATLYLDGHYSIRKTTPASTRNIPGLQNGLEGHEIQLVAGQYEFLIVK